LGWVVDYKMVIVYKDTDACGSFSLNHSFMLMTIYLLSSVTGIVWGRVGKTIKSKVLIYVLAMNKGLEYSLISNIYNNIKIYSIKTFLMNFLSFYNEMALHNQD
jgi:hypothetical protein